MVTRKKTEMSMFMEVDEDEEQSGCLRKLLCNKKCWDCVKDHCKNSSLYIFHKNSKVRKFCLQFLKAPKQPTNVKGESDSSEIGLSIKK